MGFGAAVACAGVVCVVAVAGEAGIPPEDGACFLCRPATCLGFDKVVSPLEPDPEVDAEEFEEDDDPPRLNVGLRC